MHNRRFSEPARHGTWLFTPTDDGDGPIVVLHFAMSGSLTWERVGVPRNDHDQVIFVCTDSELRFNQMRKFGGVWLARDSSERDAITGPLGPDALDIDRDAFHTAFDRGGGMI